MSEILQFGVVCHWVALILQGFLVGRVATKRKQFPVFFAYSIFLIFSSAFLYVAFRMMSDPAYYTTYWIVTALESGFGVWVVGELWGNRICGLIPGLLAAIAMIGCGHPILASAIAGKVIASLAFLSLFRKNTEKNIATGIVIYYTFPALLYISSIPLWTKFVPIYSQMCAQLVWIRSFLPSAKTSAA